MSVTVLQRYQLVAGLADTLTGLCLLVAPVWTLRLLRIEIGQGDPLYLSYIGVFVLAVGLSYFLCGPLEGTNRTRACIRWRMSWRITATFRSLVALFLLWQVLAGRLPSAWIIVATTDAAFAGFQWLGLAYDWLGLNRQDTP